MRKTSEFQQRGLSRRTILQAAAATLGVPLAGTGALAQDKLSGRGEVVVYSYGGSFTAGARKSLYEPFTKATGITVTEVVADYPDPLVRAMATAGRVDWDIGIFDLGISEFRAAGMFVPIDYSLWDDESLKGVPQGVRTSDSVLCYRTATVLVYDERAFPNGGPKNWTDFWDTKAFPGPRGLSLRGSHLPIPLAADGVPRGEIWPLTDDKVQRAIRRLDAIKKDVAKWWKAGGEPIQALLNKEYVMTSCFDGRALGAIRQGSPLKIVWDRGNTVALHYAIIKGGPNTSNAQKFIAFANRARISADFTLATSCPSANVNQLQYLPKDLLPLLNNTPENLSKLVPVDLAWLSAKRSDGKTNNEHIEAQILQWRARA